MKKILFIFSFIIFAVQINAQELKSPNGNITLLFELNSNGSPTYKLNFKNKEVIKTSKLGLELKNDKQSLLTDFSITKTQTFAFNEDWSPVWGELKTIKNNITKK